MSQDIVTTSRHAQTTGGGLSPPVGIALRAAAVVAYLILTSTLLTQLAAGSVIFQLSAVDMPSGAPKVMTITVDGPAASVDVYCATTTERAPFAHVRVSPEGIMDAYHRLCSPVGSE